MHNHPTSSFLIWQPAETLYGPRRHPLDVHQTIGVENKVRRAGLRSILKMGPNKCVINGDKHLTINYIRLNLETASLQRMEGEKELSMRTSRSLTTFGTCMESPGLQVEEPTQ